MAELLVRLNGTDGENGAALTDFVSAVKDWDSLAVTLDPAYEGALDSGTLMTVEDEDISSQDELAAKFQQLVAPSRWASVFTIVPADAP